MAEGGDAARTVKVLFTETSFGSLFLGAITSKMRWLESLAVGVYVFDLTDSPIMVAAFLFYALGAACLVGAWIGVIADRVSRKAILFGGLLTMFAVSLVLGLLTVFDLVELWHIGVGAFISGVFTSTDYSTRRAMIGEAAGLETVSALRWPLIPGRQTERGCSADRRIYARVFRLIWGVFARGRSVCNRNILDLAHVLSADAARGYCSESAAKPR